MRQITAVIADDEEALRTYLKKQLSTLWPELLISGEAGDGDAALRLIEERRPDIVFLDIKMPGLSGIEVARKTAGTAMVVFITAYNRYAVDAFENEALDYLVKPVTSERLKKTVKRMKERILASLPQPDLPGVLDKILKTLQQSAGFLQWINVKHKNDVQLIPVAEVCYFKASDKYTIVRTRDGEFLIRKTIAALGDELDPEQFRRVHRSSIVNINAVHRIDRSLGGTQTIRFKDIKDLLPVSRAYSHLFKQM
ncbi:MAG: hypothetical protein A2X56_04080 [Nitrospirae bacterium GWC2_57_13]|jgi:DNA-binding LytR/AlgR family response regulator|nr:MAG: hypothetical protein A2X56_04080 [Nitrospirae bacterium GWC2_57_13]OGW46328.1 MAG: hypothetical protein A2X57_06025 [Nitrospirae bacterium GWD2_57_8]HAR45149.1 DNA-binding response regulator [Nitrospiraceae bacterium]HAS52862.1 DNA-binding response regulator [Nitrospiraceae bacterium]